MSERTRYLLDTNVVSETRRKQPHPGVISFISGTEPSDLYLSVLTLGELRKGAASKRKTDPDAARLLAAWVDGLEFSFVDHILPIDAAVATAWGELAAQRTRPVIDTLLAASALVRGLTLVTRNTSDVRDTKVKLLDPWAK